MVRQTLERYVAQLANQPLDEELGFSPNLEEAVNLFPPPALTQLCRALGLSRFERYVLLLCAAMELDPMMGRLCAEAQGNEQWTYPTPYLASRILPEASWQAFTADAALRHWQLIEIEQGRAFTLSPMRIDESILLYLLGEEYVDPQLKGIIKPVAPQSDFPLSPSHQGIVQQVVQVWLQATAVSSYPVIQLCGTQLSDQQSVAAAICALLGCHLKQVSLTTLTATPGLLSTAGSLTALMQRWELSEQLWDTCRIQARPHLDALAQRIECRGSFADLALPEQQLQLLRDIVAQAQLRPQVYRHWQFDRNRGHGLGISALFYGPSGTGKTTAAEIIAAQLRLDLYRVDLSAVVSKYIGETEKNLAQVFDAAQMGGVVLLFDEADALFGKRGEVKESRDRYANQEVSYLLQRIESYQGIAILTTNLKTAMDKAFERRLRFIVEFPFPDAQQRCQIWQRVFPQATPTKGLNYRKLAQVPLSGGSIQNVALNAAFAAAQNNTAVTMGHILDAARVECKKIGKVIVSADFQGWGNNIS
ncbi:ATP-binding protein [Coleofasciculus sp.]|uniref:ATP-binding protein n=1 Tax=Coleofasciculus sp. TaxID=3100458 RepID=UPI003A313714